MCRIDDEDTAREIGPARSHETTPSRKGVFTKRFVRLGTATPLLATKGARARTEYAQRNHEGLCFCIITILLDFNRCSLNPSFDGQLMDTEEADIAQLCAQNIVLWQHFLEAFSGREAVHQHLARIHHQLRVRITYKLLLGLKTYLRSIFV